jgi:hypothetical protein
VGGFQLAPAVRYTRWTADQIGYSVARTRQDQVELVTRVSRAEGGLLGARASYGIIVGGTFTKAYESSGSRAKLGGPLFEMTLTKHVAVEAGAIYHPLLIRSTVDGRARVERTHVTWEIPTLAKFRRRAGAVSPFLAVGPSFRLPLKLNGGRLATLGLTAGAGIEWKVRWLRLTPSLRYTHWRADSGGATLVKRNQAAVVLGILW